MLGCCCCFNLGDTENLNIGSKNPNYFWEGQPIGWVSTTLGNSHSGLFQGLVSGHRVGSVGRNQAAIASLSKADMTSSGQVSICQNNATSRYLSVLMVELICEGSLHQTLKQSPNQATTRWKFCLGTCQLVALYKGDIYPSIRHRTAEHERIALYASPTWKKVEGMHCAFPTGHAPRSLKHRRLGSPFSPQNRNRCQDGSHGSPENRWPTCNVRVGHFFCPSVMRNSFVFFIALGQKKLSEHPAPPTHPDAASIWLTPWIRLLRTHPEVALHVVAQWKWGCTVSKPTGLLAVRLPFFGRSMHSRQQEQAIAPKRPDSKAKVSKPFS